MCAGNAFVGHNSQSERLVDVLDSVVRVSGVKGYTVRPPNQGQSRPRAPSILTVRSSPIEHTVHRLGSVLTLPTDSAFENAWGNSTTHLKPTLGEALTGWRPRKMSLVDGMDLYYAAFLASQTEQDE